MNSRLRELIRQGVPSTHLHFYSCPQGGKRSPPPAPDYTGAANAQSAASKEIATQQTWANRPNQYTPWGSTTWNAQSGVDPSTGQPITQWNQQQQLAPQLQGALDQQLGLQQDRSQLAGDFMSRVEQDFQRPFNWAGLPGMQGGPQAQLTGTYGLDTGAPQQTTFGTNEPAFAQERQRIEQGLFDRMRPEHDYQDQRTRTMLVNQGLTMGSEAYDRELERLEQNQAGERWNALNMGGSEQARMQAMLLGQQQQAFGQDVASQQAQNSALQNQFGMDLSSNAQNFGQMTSEAEFANRLRQQAIAEQSQQRNMSLNEMNALLTGQQVQGPQMPTFMTATAGQAPNYMGAMNNQYQSGLDAFNAQQAQQQGLMSGLFGLGGTIMGGPMGGAIGSGIGRLFG